MLTRRQFFATPLLAGLPGLITAAESHGAGSLELIARTSTQQLLPESFGATSVWGYGGAVPGLPIRIRQGERVRLRFGNQLPEPSSVHWHGIRIDNAMDGVAGLTQAAVAPKSQFDYDFMVPDAGSYWYHSHNRSWVQMACGLYGPLIVEETSPPEVDRDEVLMVDDWRMSDNGQINDDFGHMMQMSHGGRIGNWITVNGVGMHSASLQVQRHERLRLRLMNVANAAIFTLQLQGVSGKVVALDGQPLENPADFNDLLLAPAQRVDVIVDVVAGEGDVAGIVLSGGSEPVPIMRFQVSGEKRARPLGKLAPLAANPLSGFRSASSFAVTELTLQGGAMGRMRTARYQGKTLGIRELVQQHGMVWALNGVAGMPEEPLLRLRRDQPVRLRMVNDTGWPHGMHLHGHHFREVHADGQLGPWRDTLLFDRGETRDIAFIADNPGKWLIHCHMLEHQAAGMKTWFEVS